MQGSCLCGQVVFAVDEPPHPVIACHCTRCRKISGHYGASSSVGLGGFRLIRGEGLRWFRSSDAGQCGFCGSCGASLFWKPDGESRMCFAIGALDGPTGLAIGRHIFVECAGDYYAPEGPPPPQVAEPEQLSVSCLCGAVAFTLPGPAGAIHACHCTQCRKLSGHYSASFDADEAGVVYSAEATLAEYETPGGGRRGFCKGCGSNLWFRAADGAFSVEAGAVDGPTGGQLAEHIFVADKGDYYGITDGLPQAARW